jgi:hypothetical protein
VRQQDQIRLYNFGLYVDHGLSGQTVDALIYDEAIRIEQAEYLLGSYPCIHDTRQRRTTAVNGTGRQQYCQVHVIQLMFWTMDLVRTVRRMPQYRRATWALRIRHALQMRLFPLFARGCAKTPGWVNVTTPVR